jgi:hypothetical protein
MVLMGVKHSGKTNKTRKFFGGGPRPDNLKHKQEEAKERQEAWAKLSPSDQLKALDRRPGESKSQRERILARIEKAKQPKAPEKPANAVVATNEGESVKAKSQRPARKERPKASAR